MKKIAMNSNKSGFLVLNRIVEISDKIIKTNTFVEDRFTVIECLAQTAGIHARKKIDFSRQAFLLSFSMLEIVTDEFKTEILIKGKLVAETSTTFQYYLEAFHGKKKIATVTLSISTNAYINELEKKEKEDFYRGYYNRLISI